MDRPDDEHEHSEGPAAERFVRRLDDLQRSHPWSALPLGVVRKYADDRGSALAGLLTFQVFLGMLPLLVVALTVLGVVLRSSQRLQDAVVDSTVAQFPVVGSRLTDDVGALSVDGWWVAVSVVGLLWTATGLYNSFQLAMNQVWNVEGVDRQGLVSRLVRAAALFVAVFAAAIGASMLREAFGPDLPPGAVGTVLDLVVALATSSLLLLGVLRLVTAPSVPTGHLVPAAVLSAVAWTALQRLGRWIVTDRLAEAEDLYGAIGFVVVVLFWINLLARSVVFATEAAVVHRRRLWPRRIAQPPLTDADRRVLVGLLSNERRRPEQVIDVRFTDVDEVVRIGGDRDGQDGWDERAQTSATEKEVDDATGPRPPR